MRALPKPWTSTIIGCCVVLLTWAVGLFLSVKKTRQVTVEFYQWVHNNSTITDYYSYSIPIEETTPEVIARFNQSAASVRRHVSLGTGAHAPITIPGSYRAIGHAGASNGSGIEEGLSLVSSHCFMHLRTKPEEGESVSGSVVFVVSSSLFGL